MALYRHVAEGTTPGESWTFTLYTDAAVSLQAAQSSWVTATDALWTGSLDAIVAADVSMTEVSTAEVDVATGLQSSRLADAVTRPGASVAETLPFQCATVVSLRTIFATRSGRGRFYLPPLDTTVVAGGLLATAAQTTVLNSADAMMSSLTGSGLAPVVYSRTQRLTVVVTSIDVGNVIDTQRRRRNKLIEERVSTTI